MKAWTKVDLHFSSSILTYTHFSPNHQQLPSKRSEALEALQPTQLPWFLGQRYPCPHSKADTSDNKTRARWLIRREPDFETPSNRSIWKEWASLDWLVRENKLRAMTTHDPQGRPWASGQSPFTRFQDSANRWQLVRHLQRVSWQPSGNLAADFFTLPTGSLALRYCSFWNRPRRFQKLHTERWSRILTSDPARFRRALC